MSETVTRRKKQTKDRKLVAKKSSNRSTRTKHASNRSGVIIEKVKAGSARKPSAEATQTRAEFLELRRYFNQPNQLGKALGWSLPTTHRWAHDPLPARPRSDSAERIKLLLALCQDAARWVSDPFDVGAWAVAPDEALGGATPAQTLLTLRAEGLQAMVENMSRIAPRRSALPVGELSVDELRKSLKSLGLRPLPPVEPIEDVDLSDFDDWEETPEEPSRIL